MKIFRKMILASVAVVVGMSLTTACSDANEYEDYMADNPSWIDGKWTDSTAIKHPATLEGTTWVRTSGLKLNAFGEDVQGFVESIQFTDPDSCIVKMGAPLFPASWADNTSITWTDDSNANNNPNKYEYKYTDATGVLEILKLSINDKGAVSKMTIFTGVAVEGKNHVLTVAHYGDVPAHTYLARQ